jgi:hypothetical protein
VDQQALWDVTLEAVEKAKGFLVPVALHVLADGGAVENVERGEQGRRAIVDVVVRHRAGAPALHRQLGWGSVQGLDLALLINREHDRMRRRVDVKPDHVAQLCGEMRVAAEPKGPQPVWRQAMRAADLCTVLIATPITLAIARLVQCMVSPGGSPSVRSIKRATT